MVSMVGEIRNGELSYFNLRREIAVRLLSSMHFIFVFTSPHSITITDDFRFN